MGKKLNEKIFVDINGVSQGMFIQSEDIDNPVLLFLHGGPGSPEVAFTDKYPTGLEKIFTVCWWEQRGSGISYSREVKKKGLTLDIMIEDTVAVTEYLKERFSKKKIYILGHSWGSFLGVLTVQKHPELYYAYMGIGQIANQTQSEILAYKYIVKELEKNKDMKLLKKFLKHPIDKGAKIDSKYLGLRSKGMQLLGIGITHEVMPMSKAIGVVLHYKGYSLTEKVKFALGGALSGNSLFDDVLKTEMIKAVPKLDVPIFVFQGKYDYQVSYVLAKKYIGEIEAPVKGFYTFENSAHSPCFEEPEKMCSIIKHDVLNIKNDMADKLPN